MTDYPLKWHTLDAFDPSTCEDESTVVTRSLRAIGTTATVAVTDRSVASEALDLLAEDLMCLDMACSRFHTDSELRLVEAASRGTQIPISPLLFAVLEAACAIAIQTAGIVDPTIGNALNELGYDRDFDEIVELRIHQEVEPQPAPGWWQIRLDHEQHSVAITEGVHIDVGATAKAFAADRAAARISTALGCGVLVNLGGDVSLSGRPPCDGWAVGIGTHSTTPLDEVDLVLAIYSGGVATSGTTARTWIREGRRMHHIVDPWTGLPAEPVWSVVTTLAPTCTEANAWSTAAVVWGNDAVGNLAARGVPARLVRADGEVVEIGGWPTATDPEPMKGIVP
jgi:FAD:protein FMN transferase